MSDQIDPSDAVTDSEVRPRRTRRFPRALGTVALVVSVGVVSSLTTVWATHDFPDVPVSSPHHGDVSWAVNNGITQGYNDGTFRPTQAVSRQTMATFLRRLNAEFVVVNKATTINMGTAPAVRVDAKCQPGQRALAGGVISNKTAIYVADSYPVADTWYVRLRMENSAAMNTLEATVYVLCGPGL